METAQDRNVFDVLKERGLIKQTTHEDEIRELLGKEKVTFYIGFDPTADSLHVGHFMQIIVMMYMQKYGHKPIVLVGGENCDGRRSFGKNRYAEDDDKGSNQGQLR